VKGPSGSLKSRGCLVETSAIIAILLREPDWRDYAAELATRACKTGAVNVFEASLAMMSRGALSVEEAHERVAARIEEFYIEIVPFTPEMLPRAIAARERYGRGRKGLNMGDCLSYAAAKHLGLTLLYKGDDFARTDVNG
jgi:ribonuclease VapC